MTKRWSSTKSDLTKTKRHASKEARREFVEMILKADTEPPAAKFGDVDELLKYLDKD